MGEKDSVYRLDIGSVDSDLVGKVKVTAENENGKDEKQVSCDDEFTYVNS